MLSPGRWELDRGNNWKGSSGTGKTKRKLGIEKGWYMKQDAYDVYIIEEFERKNHRGTVVGTVRQKRHLDTVFFNPRCDGGAAVHELDVKYSLINHDGYPANIWVKKRRTTRTIHDMQTSY